MKSSKRWLSLLLAFVMLFTSFDSAVLAAGAALAPKAQTTELKGVVKGKKEIFNFTVPQTGKKTAAKSRVKHGPALFSAGAPVKAPGKPDTEITVNTKGLGSKAFDWSALPNGEFKITAKWETLDGQKHEMKDFATITENGAREFTVGWPTDGTMVRNAAIEVQYDQDINVRVLFSPETSEGQLGKLSFKIDLTELANSMVDVKYVDPYGKALAAENMPAQGSTMPNITSDNLTDVAMPLPAKSETVNMRESEDIDEAQLHAAADGVAYKVGDKGNGDKVTIDNKEYTLSISDPNPKENATISLRYEPDVLVPDRDNGEYPPVPNGYKRLTFNANQPQEGETAAVNGRFNDMGEKVKVIDVKDGVKYDNAKLKAEIAKLKPVALDKKGDPTDEKPFLEWNPNIPKDTESVVTKEYNAKYQTTADKITKAGGLAPKATAAFVGDTLNWAGSAVLSDTAKQAANAKELQGLLDKATITDATDPARTSAAAGEFRGKVKVTFEDKSFIEVDKQILYVYENGANKPGNDKPVPTDAATVTFTRDEDSIKDWGKVDPIIVKKNAAVPDGKFPNAQAKDGYNTVAWDPAKDTVITGDQTFKASATKNATSADKITKAGGLAPKATAAFVGDTLNWAGSAVLSDKAKQAANAKELQGLLDKATITDATDPARTSAAAGEFTGKVKVTFEDKSFIEVDKQILYVYENGANKPGNDKPLPNDAATITFTKDDKSIKDWGTVEPIIVKKNTAVPDGKFPNAQAKDGYNTVAWDPAKDTVITGDQTFKASATKDATPQEQTATPKITAPKAGDKTISGTSEPKAKVVVELPDGTKVIATAGDDGKWTANVPAGKELKENDVVKAVATVDGKTPSKEATATTGAADPDQSATPSINQPTEGDNAITGKGAPGAKVVVTDNNGKEIGKTTVGPDGKWSVPVPADRPLKKGDVITATQTEDGKKPASAEAIVKGKYNGGSTGGTWFIPWTPTTPSVEKPKHETAIHKAYIYGYEDSSFRPEGNMTRAEAAAMLARLQGLDLSNSARPNFIDVRSGWYNSVINAVVNAGYMKGYPDGTFRPNDKITRAEFTQMIKAIDKANTGMAPFADVKGHWAEAAINQAYANARIKGYPDGTFRPNNHITRAEAVTVFNKLYDRSVGLTGLRDVLTGIVPFNDVNVSHWAYYDIIEASNTHTFYRTVKGQVDETWVTLNQTWKDALANR